MFAEVVSGSDVTRQGVSDVDVQHMTDVLIFYNFFIFFCRGLGLESWIRPRVVVS